jgi:hypothetical protein
VGGASTHARDLALTIRIHPSKAAAVPTSFTCVIPSVLFVTPRGVRVEVGLIMTPLHTVPRGLPMMMPCRVVMEGRARVVLRGATTEPARFSRFL